MTDTRSNILDAAEQVFSENGFSGASMRVIASVAKVSQALLHYHFRTKHALYNEVFERRAKQSMDFRIKSIEDSFADGRCPDLHRLISVLFDLPPEWGRTPQSTFYSTPMVAALSVGEDERSQEMMERIYDPFALRFIEWIKMCLPGLDHPTAVLCYIFALGARNQ